MTIRIRLGEIFVTSPNSLRTMMLDIPSLQLLIALRFPKKYSELLECAEEIKFPIGRFQTYLQNLIELGVICLVSTSKDVQAKSDQENGELTIKWWDKNDEAYIDIRCHQIIQVLYGNSASIKQKRPVDREGNPLPWFSYPAIEQLKAWDLSSYTLFEYGAGNSTLFFSNRCRRLTSVESLRSWYEELRASALPNTTLYYCDTKDSYVQSIHRENLHYDIIILDAKPEFRSHCIENAFSRLKDSGVIILDDSSRYENAARYFETVGLTRIDYTGIAPFEFYAQTTSFFLTPNFKPKRIVGYQPVGAP